MKSKRLFQLGASVLAGVLVISSASLPALANTGSASRYDAAIQSKVSQLLTKDEFRNVQASTEDGIVTLQGSVDRYRAKLDAEKKVRKADHVQGVRDLLDAAGASIPDSELQAKLARKLAYDRVGYGDVFNSLTLGVKDGVVTLGGEVINYPDRDSAIGLVQNEPGVKDVVANIKVLPTSIFDDQLRLRLARMIYGDPVLSRYAIDPQVPIRIVVDNGHVTLLGVVDSAMEKQIAGIRASSVFGAFSVDNYLTVAKPIAR